MRVGSTPFTLNRNRDLQLSFYGYLNALMNLRIHLSNGARDFTHQKCLRKRRLKLLKTQMITLCHRIFRLKSTRTAPRTRLSTKIASFSHTSLVFYLEYPLLTIIIRDIRGKFILITFVTCMVTLTLQYFHKQYDITNQSINQSVNHVIVIQLINM